MGSKHHCDLAKQLSRFYENLFCDINHEFKCRSYLQSNQFWQKYFIFSVPGLQQKDVGPSIASCESKQFL